MPTYSGTTTFLSTGVQICTRAAAKIYAIDTSNSETLPTQSLNDFLYQLNVLTKEAMASPGVIPWTVQLNTLFLQQAQSSYYVGSSTGFQNLDNWTNSYCYATLANTYASAATSLVLSGLTSGSINGTAQTINVGDNIGIKLDTGKTFWTTVSSWTSGTNTVVLNAGLPSQASSGNFIYDYTTKADRPQKILEVSRSNTSLIDNIIEPISLQVYNQLPNKNENGMPLQWHFINSIPNANLLIWQPYDGTSGWDRLSCWCETIIEDFDSAGTDNPYYPVEWTNFLIWELAAEMGEEYEIADTKLQRLQQIADRKFNNLLNYSASLSKSPIQFGMQQNAWTIES